jgi:hypothetical protein
MALAVHSSQPVHRHHVPGRRAGDDRVAGSGLDREVRRLLYGVVVEFGYVVAGFDRNVSSLAMLGERRRRINFKMDHVQLGQLLEHGLRDLRFERFFVADCVEGAGALSDQCVAGEVFLATAESGIT